MSVFKELREALELDLITGFSFWEPFDASSTGTCRVRMTPEFREFFDPIDKFEELRIMVFVFGGTANFAPTPLDLDRELFILTKCFSML